MNEFLASDIKFLKGVGSTRAEVLQKELGIFCFADLINYYPFRYVDRSKFYKISEIETDTSYIQLKGRIKHIEEVGALKKKRLVASFSDGQQEIDLLWFKGINWIKKTLKINAEIVIFGKPNHYKGSINFSHPEIDTIENRLKSAPLEAVYHTSEMMKTRRIETKVIRQIIKNALNHERYAIPEIFSDQFCKKYKLIPRKKAFQYIHQPPSQRHIEAAQYRFKFEELFFLQFPFIQKKINRKKVNHGIAFEKKEIHYNTFLDQHLAFDLTNAQKKVLGEISSDLYSGKQMNRLLQGDVGSGKTIVAFLTMLRAIDNNYQASLMAPTEILAIQHYIGLKELADKINIQIGLLTGSTPKKERIELHEKLLSGDIKLKVLDFVKEQIIKGRQAYIVYPLIEESEKLHYKDLNNGYDELLLSFPRPKYQVEMLHGKMKPNDKEAKMKDFAEGKTHILVSTTVIEVGINVPNASIMIIESAEKFGLSQLHQLRGRVGRGDEQSYCILLSSKKLSNNAKTRLQAMVQTSSGFELSEIDMQLRGFGDIAGTRQSGLDQLKLASLNTDSSIAEKAREAAIEILSEDPKLSNYQSLYLFMKDRQGYIDWENIA
ncbi:MAG: ATP-dependent DNA helicase RecG [Bacteroidetes bacterium]|nr:ATP-dependent DNA helicase RecG [Bacteroidota bacterium]